MEKLWRDGKVAVLYSPGFGAGWYTWNTDHEAIIFHPRIVELVETNQRHKITKEFMEELGFPHIYCGGAEDLVVEWLPKGTSFQINEYDGSESIQTIDRTPWLTA